ncbi:MAG: hypothetical protein Q9P01_11545, partial [Anaerolineae bacterium]|nr:hypothetical protein [Anaerolineae bacterium]
MSNIRSSTPTGTNAVGFVVIGISLLLVLVGFFSLPWLTYDDFDASYSGFALLSLDADEFADDPLEGEGEAALTITYDWNRDDEVVSGELPVYDLFPSTFGSNLFFVVLIMLLIAFFAGYAYIVQNRKYDFVSSISWASIIGIYGILFLLFFAFVSQANREDEFRRRLTRDVLVAIDESQTVEESSDASGERLTVASIADEIEYSNYDGAVGTISFGFWVMMLGMVGMVGQ